MCKIHGYRYSCGHQIRYLHSRCRGTYAWSSRRAACVTDYYILIASPSECGPCQHRKLTGGRQARVETARSAHYGARGRRVETPGPYTDRESGSEPDSESQNEPEASGRVLPDTHRGFTSSDQAFPHLYPPQVRRERYERSKCQPRCAALSPLRTEVRPEDIVEPASSHACLPASAPASFPTFRSFFVQTYGLSGPDVDVGRGAGASAPRGLPASERTQPAPAAPFLGRGDAVQRDLQTAQPHTSRWLPAYLETSETRAPGSEAPLRPKKLCWRPRDTSNTDTASLSAKKGYT